MEIQRGDALPIPCRSCGQFLGFKVEGGVFQRTCPACQRITVITCKQIGGEWTIRTAPDGAMIRRS